MAQQLARLLFDLEDARSNPPWGSHTVCSRERRDDLWWTRSPTTVLGLVMPPNGGSCIMVMPHNGGQSVGDKHLVDNR